MPPKAHPAGAQGRARSIIEEKHASSNPPMQPIRHTVRAPAAAAASVLPSLSASAVASSSADSASSAAAACNRLDADSLSVVFSFLDMRDFLCAVRVSRHWRSARVKKSAWPAFSLETMIGVLRDDDLDNPQRRKFELALKSEDLTEFDALLSQPGVMELWRHATEIKLIHNPGNAQARTKRPFAAMLALLPQFASLAALTLDGFIFPPETDDPATQLFDALSSRLLMLGLSRHSRGIERQLHRLSSLRVLVLGWIPEAESLLPLQQLVYLHFQSESRESAEQPSALLGYALRWLSVHHALRSLSIEGVEDAQRQRCLFALLSCEAADLHDADLATPNRGLLPQLDPSVPCVLTDFSIQYMGPATMPLLDSVPSLTRLQASIVSQHGGIHPARQLQLTLPRLQQLQLQGDEPFKDWHELVHCSALRVVRLSQHRPSWPLRGLSRLSQATLHPLLTAWSATLEECRLDLKLELDTEERESGHKPWPELVACHRLRILELRLTPGQSLPAGLVAALQGLPSFQSLVLRFEGRAMCPLPSNLLSVMCRSHSFSTLHLHSLSIQWSPDFVQATEIDAGCGLSAMLADVAQSDPALLTSQTVKRLRVVGHQREHSYRASQVRSFRIVLTAEHPKWECEN